jgi:hypothetical protein
MRHTGFFLLLPLLAGCLERREHMRIEPDGTVRIELAFDADSLEELHAGDAVPSLDQGWLVSESSYSDAQGRERFRMNAQAAFGPAAELPQRFGGLADPMAEVVLRFPTTLTVEERGDGVYYHFRRQYPARAWARVDLPRQAVRQGIEEAIGGRPLEKLPPEERRRLVRRFAELEILEFQILARVAFAETSPAAPQDVWLALHAAVGGRADALDQEALADLLARDPRDDPRRDVRIEEAVAAFRSTLLETALDSLRSSGWYPISSINRFAQRLQRERWDLEVTEDLGDDTFKVSVEMPGELVGHNGASASGSTVTFEFAGPMLRDRSLELLVTSRVATRR